MLKIIIHSEGEPTLFELEGKLAGPWVEELESCWQQMKIADRQVGLMLKSVTFIDGPRKKLLAEMHQHGVELVAEGCMTKAIIETTIRGESL
jgi:hypothetical protein